jgi:beta-glucanase (GH16 family)
VANAVSQWPYTYDHCDVGTAPNQTLNGLPRAAVTDGDNAYGGALSYLPGQRLSRCTCDGEDHPGPKHADGTYVGRSAPEIDILEAQMGGSPLIGQVSQSAQWAVSTEF